jgi:hypothetical protein
MSAWMRPVLLVGTLVVSGTALACGACDEDKIAATYDHAVIAKAQRQSHVVVFAAVESRRDGRATTRAVESAARTLRGVDRASVRTAINPPALSFSLDPQTQSPADALVAIQRAGGMQGIELRELRVVK